MPLRVQRFARHGEGMIAVISPAKTLDMESPACVETFTQPDFLDDAQELIDTLRGKSPDEVAALMKLSGKLARLNVDRYAAWDRAFTPGNAKQAVLAFRGDVYAGMEAERFGARDFQFAQKHLRILSGLYGLLRPLDLMQAYRLEMGTGLATARGSNLYEFWGDRITRALNRDLRAQRSGVLVNLASQEYFRAVRVADLEAEVVTPVFKDEKNGVYKVISFHAKKARGMMSAHMIRNRVKDIEGLKTFDTAGYRFSAGDSDERELVFLREDAQA